jgi:hypothetical protein
MMMQQRRVHSMIWATLVVMAPGLFDLRAVVVLLGSRLTTWLSSLGYICPFLVLQCSTFPAFASMDNGMLLQGPW